MSSLSIKEFCHQVAGHKEETILSIHDKFLLKPMIKKDLFNRELNYYQSMCRTVSIGRFTAKFFGLLHLSSRRNLDSSAPDVLLPHLVLEDATYGFNTPNIIDIKIGTCTFEPSAPEEKKVKEVKKYPHQSTLGFRITGFKLYDGVKNEYTLSNKHLGRTIQPDEAVTAVALLFFNGKSFNIDAIRSTLTQMKEILCYMQEQTLYRYISTSLLIVYNGKGDTELRCDSIHQSNCECANPAGRQCSIRNSLPDLESQLCDTSANKATLSNMSEYLDQQRSRSADFGCSGMAALEDQEEPAPPMVRVKMIDFAHAVSTDSLPDEEKQQKHDCGYIHGLTSLINKMERVLELLCADDPAQSDECNQLHTKVKELLARAIPGIA
jgi:hypothetical protein